MVLGHHGHLSRFAKRNVPVYIQQKQEYTLMEDKELETPSKA